jgi:cytochrome b
MNAQSTLTVGASVPAQPARRILVWDAPVRVFHWLMAISFAGAYLTAESDQWLQVHVTLGYTMAGLVVFRLVWGLIGTRYARFSSFVRGFRSIGHYLRTLVQGKPEHYVGHNPAGALAIIAMLGLSLVVVSTGWATYSEVAGEWMEDIHEAAANLMLAVVFAHIAGVLISSLLHHENLVGAMLSGYKTGSPEEGVRRAWRVVAALLLVAVLGFWWMQLRADSSPGAHAERPAATMKADRHDHGDDDD